VRKWLRRRRKVSSAKAFIVKSVEVRLWLGSAVGAVVGAIVGGNDGVL